MSSLETSLADRQELSVVHVSLLCVEPDAPWVFCSSRPTQLKTPPTKSPHPSRSTSTSKGHQNIFTDITTTVYALSPYTNFPRSLPPTVSDLGLSLPFIPEPPSFTSSEPTLDHSHSPLPHPLPLLPRSSTTLICAPTSPTAITMLHIHFLHTLHTSPCSASVNTSTPQQITSLHADITRNFHDLAVLARVRWRLGSNPVLPFHLAAVEAMRVALDRDQYSMDGADP